MADQKNLFGEPVKDNPRIRPQWFTDKGAIPGEPYLVFGTSFETGPLAILPVDTGGVQDSYELRDDSGTTIKQSDDCEELQKLAEKIYYGKYAKMIEKGHVFPRMKTRYRDLEELRHDIQNQKFDFPDFMTVGKTDYRIVEYSMEGVQFGDRPRASRYITFADEDTLKKEINLDLGERTVEEQAAGIDWAVSQGLQPRQKQNPKKINYFHENFYRKGPEENHFEYHQSFRSFKEAKESFDRDIMEKNLDEWYIELVDNQDRVITNSDIAIQNPRRGIGRYRVAEPKNYPGHGIQFVYGIAKGAPKQNPGASHRPGPWRVQDGYVVDAEGLAVAEFSNPAFSAEVESANARLIAAAPELLGALEQLIWAIEKRGSGMIEHAVAYAKHTAIAKATGRTK